MKNKKFGFTLAEVLITLAIIGVVAALTLPTLISNHNKKVIETRLKQNYAIFHEIIKLSNGSLDPVNMQTQEELNATFNEYITPNLNMTRVCYQEIGCWQQTDEVTKALSGEQGAKLSPYGQGEGSVCGKLNNGSNFCIDWWYKQTIEQIFGVNMPANAKDRDAALIILMDLNGDALPNMAGKDTFFLVYNQKLGLVPAGFSKSKAEIENNCSKEDSENNAGYYCLMRIKDNDWKIPENIWK